MKSEIMTLIVSLIVVCLIYALGYQSASSSGKERYALLEGKISQQKEEAAKRLAEMTKKRDAIQEKLDREFERQEEKDAATKIEIDRLAAELEHRPVRVRIVTSPSRACSGSTATGQAEGSAVGAGHTDTAYGLLQPENTRRLAASLKEVEELSAAYTSCRNTLLNQEKLRE